MTTDKVQFSQEQKDFLFGSLLGDSSLQSNEVVGKDNACRLRVVHKAAHNEYVEAKYGLVAEFTNTRPQKYTLPLDNRTGVAYERSWFNTLYTPSLRFYWGMFYKKQADGTYKKRLPTYGNLMTHLTPRAIAWWFMDDGSLKDKGSSNAMRISTESFTLDETRRLCQVLKDKYNISATPQKKDSIKNTYLLYIRSESAVDFANIIKPYLVDCMKYKVTNGRYGSLADK